MTHSSSLISFFLLVLLFLCVVSSSRGSERETGSLLEFKKGISNDPLGKIQSTWNLSSLPDPKACPVSWTGVTCDPASDSVISIDLSQMGLYGDLKFSTLLNLKELQNLSLAGNNFSGRLVPALGSMSSLKYLDLSGNSFIGPIPGRIMDLWGLNYLNLSGNKFEGGLQGSFRNLQQLRVLDLHSNQLKGDIGQVLSGLRNVEVVDLSLNQFYGGLGGVSVDNVSGIVNTMKAMNLSQNGLNGRFFPGDVMGLFKSLEVLDLSGNAISGELPVGSFGNLMNLKVLRLGNNQLFGMVPEDLLQSVVPIQELDLSGNGFTGSIPGINSTSLNVLNLSSNSLSGSLLSSLKSCKTMDLSRNMISGDISVMKNWETSLEFLDLSSNKLSGSLPNLTSQFYRLNTLNLRNNLLVGNLPSLMETTPRLVAVDLSSNGFSGSIPGSFFTSNNLVSLNLSSNKFVGPIPFQGSRASELLVLPTYPLMESLDLSDNSLEGVLPSDIGNLGRLKLLNLANNDLSGQLPTALGKLSDLEYLDLSGNKFNGHIPDNLSSRLIEFNVSNNDLSGPIPKKLRNFPKSCFRPGNHLLIIPDGMASTNDAEGKVPAEVKHHSSKNSIRVAIIVASVGAALMIVFVLLAYHRAQLKEFHGRTKFSGQTAGSDIKEGRLLSLFNFHSNVQRPPTSLSFSNDHLLISKSRSLSGPTEFATEITEQTEGVAAGSASMNPNLMDIHPATSGRKSSPGSPLSSSPRFVEAYEQPVKLDVYSPDRLAGELFFLDASLAFTAEELSRAPAEVLGRSSHGTLYKATLDNGHMLTVKWLRVGLVKHKKEFAKEVKKIGSMRHPNIVPLRAYYWGPREQERLLLADYIQGDSLSLHLYESTPRRYSPLSFIQRLKVAVDVAQCLLYLHDRGLPHGNLKPTNILLTGQDYNVRLTDYGLHRLMTPAGIAEQILNLGALGYRAPELANASRPALSFKADVYAFGVILMELLTRRSAGDIISGQSGAVDLTDWVRLCDQEGRGMDCIDRDIAGGEEPTKAMDDLLTISLRCILPVNERPNIRQVFDDLCSISS
ncbi:probable inactive receptor kinase At5g10020 isoform X3 [Pistacia vera]|uniref:probable inactive receptor kinase At5g10020 isoform X3 n=1 Tax=Pistacia vera TaxID=55513 RepID=UPI001263A531|nr:probable inactive receptor kinase At5g10020 isoform X3 [Pistacia vera]